MRHFSGERPPVNEDFVNNLAKTMPFFVKTRRPPYLGAGRKWQVVFDSWLDAIAI